MWAAGSLDVHVLVPDTLRGAARKQVARRAQAVADQLRDLLRKRYAAARPAKDGPPNASDKAGYCCNACCSPRSSCASRSLAPHARRAAQFMAGAPAGVVDTSLEGWPSSARKLLEAFAYVGEEPAARTASIWASCPGAGRSRRLGCSITAVDRRRSMPRSWQITTCASFRETHSPSHRRRRLTGRSAM